MSRFKQSIAFRFIVVLAIIMTIGQAAGGFFYIFYSRSTAKSSLEQRMALTTRLIERLSLEPLVAGDSIQIRSYLENTMADDPDIGSIRVTDKNGVVVAEHTRKNDSTAVFTAKRFIKDVDETMGAVALTYSTGSLDQAMRQSFVIIPVCLLVMLIVTVTVVMYLFNVSITRPVTKIKEEIARIIDGDLTVTIDTSRQDEIGMIAEGVSIMLGKLTATMDTLNSLANKVNAIGAQLHATFDAVTTAIEMQRAATQDVAVAIENAAASHRQIISHTDQLQGISHDNVASLLEIAASSEQIVRGSDHLNTNISDSYAAVAELAQSAKGLFRISSKATDVVQNAATSVAEIYNSIGEVEKVIKESADLSEQATDIISNKGVNAVSEVRQNMARIGTFITALTGTIEQLGRRSVDIENILDVIEDVTEQIRLLSLNAQIIAQQLGEKGKSFSVVADEMKTLSGKTAVSTKEIEAIIDSIKHEIHEAVAGARETVVMVQEGDKVATQTDNVLKEILNASQVASMVSRQIETAAAEQTRGLEMVLNAIGQMKETVLSVNTMAGDQEKNTGMLLENISAIKEMMDRNRNAVDEQSKNTRSVTENLERADTRTVQIAQASQDEQEKSETLVETMSAIIQVGDDTSENVQKVSSVISDLLREMETMKKQLTGFRRRSEG